MKAAAILGLALALLGCDGGFDPGGTTSSSEGSGGSGTSSSSADGGGTSDGGGGSGASSTTASGGSGTGGNCGDTSSDKLNCGACGHSCLGAACEDGLCQPTPITDEGAISVAVSDVAVVWGLSSGGANAASLDGSGVRPVPTGNLLPVVAAASNGTRFALAENDFQGQAYVQIFDGAASAVQMSPPAPGVVSLAMDDARIYWGGQGVTGFDWATQTPTIVVSPTAPVKALDVTSQSVFWTDAAAGEIREASLSGSNQPGAPVLDSLFEPCRLAVGSGTLTWVECYGTSENAAWSADADGSSPGMLGDNAELAVARDGQDVYWIDHDKVRRMPLGGGSTETVGASNPGTPSHVSAMAVGSDRVYWAGAGVWWVAK
jgi:hypothetical protein